MRYLIIIPLFLFKSLSFCQSFKTFKIQPAIYSFNLNKYQGGYSKFIEYDENNEEFIRSVDKPYKTLEIFSTKTHQLKYTVPLKAGAVGSFKKMKNNTFWVHDLTANQYLLVDKNGKINKKIKEPEYSNNLAYIYTSYSNFTPIVTYNNALYVTGRLMFNDYLDININELRKTGIVKKLGIDGKNTFIGKPASLSLKNFYGNMLNYSITNKKNMLIVSPQFSDEIQVINLDDNSIKFVKLKTKYEALIKPLSLLKNAGKFTNQQRNEYFKNSYTNVGLIYDKYRDIYYRFVRLPSNTMGAMMCNILIFDKNFNLMFENKIDQKKYNASQFFITEKGLAIFNVENYKKDNTKLVFDLFILK
jgi:hypothetical protein